MSNLQKKDILLSPIGDSLASELADKIYLECHFCQKFIAVYPEYRKLYEKLSGNYFHCNYCLQNNLNNKNNRHVLILTFRGIIAFYDLILYKEKKIYKSEISDFISSHQATGLLNPAFRYDPESYLWFVDFNKVGHGAKKISLKDVLKTVVNMLTCFNFKQIDGIRTHDVYIKYEEAIEKFYTNRYRPTNKKILAPTLLGCGYFQYAEKNMNDALMRNYTSEDFNRT